jgi:DNA adenine methylase
MTTKIQRLTRQARLSPLRYPGGKQLLAPYVAGVIEENFLTGCSFYEPFAGGSAVSLELLRLGYIDTATLLERDPLVYAFWWSVCNQFDDLWAAIQVADVSLKTWKSLLPLRDVNNPHDCEYSLLQLGVAGLFFNRTNFSGVIGAGPIGGIAQKSQYKIDCRFNKIAIGEALNALRPFISRIRVEFADSLEWLAKNAPTLSRQQSFVYIDPPYFEQGWKLYRHSFKEKQHEKLAQLLTSARYPWLLSYDDAPFIRSLYAGSKLQPIYLDYRVKSSRLAQEIVISNLEIPPPVYEGFSLSEFSHPPQIKTNRDESSIDS